MRFALFLVLTIAFEAMALYGYVNRHSIYQLPDELTKTYFDLGIVVGGVLMLLVLFPLISLDRMLLDRRRKETTPAEGVKKKKNIKRMLIITLVGVTGLVAMYIMIRGGS
jgi:hypothetical protein